MTERREFRGVRFGLRTLMILTAIVAIAISAFSREKRRQQVIRELSTVSFVGVKYASGPSLRKMARRVLGNLISQNVESLILDDSHLIDSDIEGMEVLSEMTSLNLSGNCITDTGLRRIGYLTNLEELYLGGDYARKITDEGLLSITRLRKLERLELRTTGIRGRGLVALTKMPELEWLSLWKSHVDDSGLDHLKKLTGLKTLIVGRTSLSTKAIVELQRALPKCEVIDDI